MRIKTRFAIVTVAFIVMLAGAVGLFRLGGRATPGDTSRELRVLAYSSFVSPGGAGPEIARRFEEKTGVHVVYQDGDDAGLLLKKLELFPVDIVIGIDQFGLGQARAARKWKKITTDDVRFSEPDFLPFDWGPVAIVFRQSKGFIPPASLDDLLDKRFSRSLALQDPRTSSPGLQFLFWVLHEKGIEKGFAYLEKLKASVHSVSASWSTAYGLFQNGQAPLVVSYLTSPVYHWINDKDETYQAAIFENGHPVQVEYAGIPESCRECSFAAEFARYLLEPEIQKLIMQKNFMLPIVTEVEKNSDFARVPRVKTIDLQTTKELLDQRENLLRRWEKLGL